jgi:hypothetical protein
MHDALCKMHSAITKSKNYQGKEKKANEPSKIIPNPTHHVATTPTTPSDPNAADSCPTHTFVRQILCTERVLGLASYEECRSYAVITLVWCQTRK